MSEYALMVKQAGQATADKAVDLGLIDGPARPAAKQPALTLIRGDKDSDPGDFTFIDLFAGIKIPGRTNFSSPHLVGIRNKRTGLTAVLSGFDPAKRAVLKGGALSLVTDGGEVAVSWDFAALIQMWTTKHSKTAFVPYKARKVPRQQYAYGDIVGLAEGADFLRFLEQLALRHIAYDPGTWIMNGKLGKARSQFRVPGRYVPGLYESIEHVPVPLD